MMRLVFFLILFFLASCHFLIPSYRSQLGYQRYDSYVLDDSFHLVKFNPKSLIHELRQQPGKTYIVFLHDNRCGGIVKINKKLMEVIKGQESIILIPVVHDYVYDFSKSIKNKYGKSQKIYYTDTKKYGRSINSIMSWHKKVLPQFIPNYHIEAPTNNFYHIDSMSNSRVYFYQKSVESLQQLLDSAQMVQLK